MERYFPRPEGDMFPRNMSPKLFELNTLLRLTKYSKPLLARAVPESAHEDSIIAHKMRQFFSISEDSEDEIPEEDVELDKQIMQLEQENVEEDVPQTSASARKRPRLMGN